jgi:HPt (histidine-containing phosphotransfer) domain-containing protein
VSGGGAELERVLADLRRQYLHEAPERLAELRGALARAGAGSDAALKELRLLFHRLAGSGGSYGLDDVTASARAGEQLAYQLEQRGGRVSDADVEALTTRIGEVAAAFRASDSDRGLDPKHNTP